MSTLLTRHDTEAFLPDPDRQAIFSIVVTVVESGAALLRCLTAVRELVTDGQTLDVIIPYDATIPEVASLSERFPQFRFVNLGDLLPPGARLDPFLEHELFDKRRAAGLSLARGALVGMLEDRGAPRSDWLETMMAEHAAHEVAAVGGAVVNVAPDAMSRALFVCDYGRHFPPFSEGPTEYLTDINICYRWDALEAVRDLWKDRYQETAVHWTLLDRGYSLWLSRKPVVLHARGRASVSRILSERLQWGRVFGIQRTARWPRERAWLSAAAAVTLLPVLLVARQTRLLVSKGVRLPELVPTVGALMAVIPAWSLGEAIGYLQPRRTSEKGSGVREAPPE